MDHWLKDCYHLPSFKILEGNLKEGGKATEEKGFFAIFGMEQVFEDV